MKEDVLLKYHEYLIEQVQHESKDGGTMTINFNHPVKELVCLV